MTTISVVTWNCATTVVPCIESILRQSRSDFEVIVTDNDSRDETCALVESFKDRRVKLDRLHENRGFCGGHNRAIGRSSGDFVLLVNPDVRLSSDYLATALDRMESDRSIGTVCGLLLQSDRDEIDCRIDSSGMIVSGDCRCRLRFHGQVLRDLHMDVTEVFGADGALPLYRRSMIEDVAQYGEFFDSMFFAHKEDWDVAWRARWRGWKTICDPSCVAVHPRFFKPETLKVRAAMSAEVRYHAVKNQLILLLKNIDFATGLQRLPVIAFRQLEILSYVLLFEWGSLKAYSFVMRNVFTILRNRQTIRSRRKVSPRQMRRFLDGEFS